ncbi:MAG TPA: hypothetical protein VHL09_01100 [Dehalococcoidia bacterium]|nr:hypothetical protein [Dehalococcoidia bacterium]
MWIEMEPADVFMFRISLLFSRVSPDPEDAWIREYLEKNQLEPRRTFETEREGEPLEVLQYGQCYLGNHLYTIRDLRRRGIERMLVRQAIPELLDNIREDPATREGISDAPLSDAAVEAIAERIHPAAEFVQDEEGRVAVGIEPDLLRSVYLEVTGGVTARSGAEEQR